MIRIYIYIAVILFANSLFAQKENNIWHFGERAGVDFNSGAPVPLYNSAIETFEGCASICDANGEILFYTNGVTVWNKKNIIMDNGYNLDGSVYATHSATILKCPGEENLYYIFTIGDREGTDEEYFDKCKYSTVDMSKDGGLGSVIEKNVPLVDFCTEKFVIVRHQNPDEYWAVGHYWDTDEFWALHITNNGIESPLIWPVGSVHGGRINGNDGVIKASHKGDKIAVAVKDNQFVEILKFDNITGELSDPVRLKFDWAEEVYAVEFSPDDSKLYVTTFYSQDASDGYESTYSLQQFDVTSHDENDIRNSQINIRHWNVSISGNDPDGYLKYVSALGMMQCGPDGKIYISRFYMWMLSSIENPNVSGVNCNFVEQSVALGKGMCNWGLPADIRGESTAQPGEVQLWTPDTLAEVGDHHFKLPVYAKFAGDYNPGDTLTLTAKIDMDAFFFQPTGISSGTFTDVSFNNGRLEMEIEVPDIVPGNNSGIITEISGIVLFADTNHTDIYINDVDWENPLIETVTFDGSMRLYGDCIPKNRMIQFTEEPEFLVSPNPASENINIKYSGVQGDYELKLVSVSGETAYDFKWRNDFSQGFNELNINTDDLVSGQYFLILQSPYGVVNRRLSIVK